MKLNISLLLFLICVNILAMAQVENTSYTNSVNERILRISTTVPLGMKDTWNLFATDAGLIQWIAPLAHIELKNGGYIVTNYDKTKTLSDSSSIKLKIISYLENELLVLKVDLNDNFSKKMQEQDQDLIEIVRFEKLNSGKTKIISSMVGWGKGTDWDKIYNFFVKGNEWTYKELLNAALKIKPEVE